MRALGLPEGPLRILVAGAHPDDIEIGCGGTLLRLVCEGRVAALSWVVLTGSPERQAETRAAAAAIGGGLPLDIRLHGLRDGYLPAAFADAKGVLVDAAAAARGADGEPDLVLVPRRDDAHQDHRLLAELGGQVFRDHLVLEYEIPKYDGDLGTANIYVPLPPDVVDRKLAVLNAAFPSQRGRDWWSDETFRALLRLRGIESRAASGYAEAFVGRKLVV